MTNTGNIQLDRQITKEITIMELSADKAEFNEKFWQLHRKQLPLDRPETLKLAAPKGPLPLFPNSTPLLRSNRNSRLRRAQESAWRKNARRVDNGAQVRRVTELVLKRGSSVDFGGYYQHHVKAA